jgi:predicted CxxxxCH...CXXCH cytochrome family protein
MRRIAHDLIAAGLLLGAAIRAPAVPTMAQENAPPARLDPAAWGADHVGKPFPPYVTGDECLFCHRDIGNAWGQNRHQLTVRPAAPDDAALAALRDVPGDAIAQQTQFLLGAERVTRFLKRSKEYGKLDLHSTAFSRREGQLKNDDAPAWQAGTFGDRCAGCHATAVETNTRAFAAISLDCFTCHGDVPLEHTKDVSRVLLSSQNAEARQVISLCGQCHLRGGKSKSTGRPYPNTFVAGDNLFRDFEVDFSEETIAAATAIDRHIFLNVRDAAAFGRSDTTCLTCHDVHGQSTAKHQNLADAAICSSCHVPQTDNAELRDEITPSQRLRTHSRVCDY